MAGAVASLIPPEPVDPDAMYRVTYHQPSQQEAFFYTPIFPIPREILGKCVVYLTQPAQTVTSQMRGALLMCYLVGAESIKVLTYEKMFLTKF